MSVGNIAGPIAMGLLLVVTSLASSVSADDHIGMSRQELRGGEVVRGARGVVELVRDPGNGPPSSNFCTGTMIAPDAVLTAAHCLGGFRQGDAHNGTAEIVIRYFDPDEGLRTVHAGPADWFAHPDYSFGEVDMPGSANADIAIIRTPAAFVDTDHKDYAPLYADRGARLKRRLQAYGAGIHNYSGDNDARLRTHWFEVENVERNHVIADNRRNVTVCKGDSGGPLMLEVTDERGDVVPIVVGVAALIELFGFENRVCGNNDFGVDDAAYSRTNWGKLRRVASDAGLDCGLHQAAGFRIMSCFEVPGRTIHRVRLDCAVSGDNAGCQVRVHCPAGTHAVQAKAACNLESGSIDAATLDRQPADRITVVRASDDPRDGRCAIGDESIASGDRFLWGVAGRRFVEISCRERDRNGGDCHILGEMACE